MFCTPDISDKGSGIEISLERIACTVCNSYLTERLDNNCDICRWRVAHVFASRRVALYCSMRRCGRYNTWLNRLEHRYSGMIQGRQWHGQGEVLEQAWDSIQERGLGEEVDCSKSENMQGSTLLGMFRGMLEEAVEGEAEKEEEAVGECSSWCHIWESTCMVCGMEENTPAQSLGAVYIGRQLWHTYRLQGTL